MILIFHHKCKLSCNPDLGWGDYVSSGDTAVLHQAMEYYDILHRFQQYHCHSPCKLSKRFENWNGWSGRARFIKAFFVTARWRNEMKHVARYWPFVRGIHRLLVDSLHRGQWSEASMFSLICARTSGWANNGHAGCLRRHRAHYDVTVMNMVHPRLRHR